MTTFKSIDILVEDTDGGNLGFSTEKEHWLYRRQFKQLFHNFSWGAFDLYFLMYFFLLIIDASKLVL
jgi:hypothetical protein